MSETPRTPAEEAADAANAADATSPGTLPPAAPDAGRGETAGSPPPKDIAKEIPREIGGRDGPDPVRYGDWEKNGRCIDF